MNNFCTLESQNIDKYNYNNLKKNIINENIKDLTIEFDNLKEINDLKPMTILTPILFLTHISLLCSQIKH